MKLNSKKMIIPVSAILGIGALSVGVGAGNYFVNYGLVRPDAEDAEHDDLAPSFEKTDVEIENIAYYKEKVKEWKKEVPPAEVYIKSYDGLSLWANEYKNENSDNWLIAVHGYQSNHASVEDYAYEYYEKGFNVIIPDLRAHGNSEGEYIGMGLNDSLDIIEWIDYIININPDAKVVLHGQSMGAATVMMVAGHENLPDNVVAVVEDCGYTNAYQMMIEQLDYRFNLPSFPIMNFAKFMGKIRAGYNLNDANPLKALENATVPILFIHGDQDTFVLPYMHTELYESYNGEKDSLIVKNADHVASRNVEVKAYYDKVFEFVGQYI